MAENIIDLDPETMAAIDRAAELLGTAVTRRQEREKGEFTSLEFAKQKDISARQAADVLAVAVADGKFIRRWWVGDGKHGCYLYKVGGQ